MAPAISFMYLSTTLGVTAGLPVINAVLQTALRSSLGWRLPALGLEGEEVRKVSFLSLSSCYGSSPPMGGEVGEALMMERG